MHRDHVPCWTVGGGRGCDRLTVGADRHPLAHGTFYLTRSLHPSVHHPSVRPSSLSLLAPARCWEAGPGRHPLAHGTRRCAASARARAQSLCGATLQAGGRRHMPGRARAATSLTDAALRTRLCAGCVLCSRGLHLRARPHATDLPPGPGSDPDGAPPCWGGGGLHDNRFQPP